MTVTIQANVFHGEGKRGVEAAPQPQLAANHDVLLRLESAGIEALRNARAQSAGATLTGDQNGNPDR